MSKTETISKDELEHLYIARAQSISQIAQHFQVTSTTIRRLFNKYNIVARPNARALKKPDSHKRNRTSTVLREGSFTDVIGADELSRLYSVEGLSAPQIAKAHGVNPTSVYRALRFYNIQTSDAAFYNTVTADQLKQLYETEKRSIYDIGSLHGVDAQRVLTALKHHNIPIKDRNQAAADRARAHWPTGSAELLDDETWLRNQLNTCSQSEVAEILECSQTAVSDAAKRHGIIASIKKSRPQRMMESWLTEIGVEFEANNRNVISPHELDIYIPAAKLAIEVNGEWWHCDAHERITPTYHQAKTQKCNELGISLYHIWTREVLDPVLFKIIQDKILTKLSQAAHRVYARKCSVEPCTAKAARLFYSRVHIQQDRTIGSINYGLLHDGTMVGCISFSTTKTGLYLVRFAVAANTIVPGGFSKLLSRAIRDHSPATIDTYANGRFFNPSNVYEVNGFQNLGWTVPGYEYLKNGCYLSRQQAQKNKLHGLLERFDPAVTEQQNMINNGWHRLYDCGHVRYRLIINPHPI